VYRLCAECCTDVTVDKEMSKRIMQARLAKKMSQKDLGAACALDAKIIVDYENGKALPNQAIITKLERVLGAKLRAPKGGK
jgi:putative transcription factor